MTGRNLIGVFAAALVAQGGCASPTFKVRYSEDRLADDTYKVEVHGTPSTSKEQVRALLERRCAEVTVKSGYDAFVVLTSDESTKTFVNQVPGSSSDSGGRTVQNTYNTAVATIRMSKGERPPGAVDAREVLNKESPPEK